MFLTLEDPNAKIKGSRDPLGAQPIWASFGRHVVTNLTMQTNSARGVHDPAACTLPDGEVDRGRPAGTRFGAGCVPAI